MKIRKRPGDKSLSIDVMCSNTWRDVSAIISAPSDVSIVSWNSERMKYSTITVSKPAVVKLGDNILIGIHLEVWGMRVAAYAMKLKHKASPMEEGNGGVKEIDLPARAWRPSATHDVHFMKTCRNIWNSPIALLYQSRNGIIAAKRISSIKFFIWQFDAFMQRLVKLLITLHKGMVVQ